jgi:hypothetical protein
MKLHATPSSVSRSEVSLLATVESVGAAALTIVIAARFETYWPLATAAALAPLLLLRTPQSTLIGLHLYKRFETLLFRFFEEPQHRPLYIPWRLVRGPLAMALMLSVPTGIKVVATTYSVFRWPLHSFRRIPVNWYRMCFALDSTIAPEIVPGRESGRAAQLGVRTMRFRQFLDLDTRWHSSWPLRVLEMPVHYIGGVVPFVPAVAYRLSLKSSFYLYLPLVWLTSRAKRKTNVLVHIATSERERLMRAVAWVTLLFSGGGLFMLVQEMKAPWGIGGNIVAQYLVPIEEIDSWHVSRMLAAAITIALYFYSDEVLRRGDTYALTPRSRLAVDVAVRARTVLSLWTIGCGLYLLLHTVDWSRIPRVRWLPFS